MTLLTIYIDFVIAALFLQIVFDNLWVKDALEAYTEMAQLTEPIKIRTNFKRIVTVLLTSFIPIFHVFIVYFYTFGQKKLKATINLLVFRQMTIKRVLKEITVDTENQKED